MQSPYFHATPYGSPEDPSMAAGGESTTHSMTPNPLGQQATQIMYQHAIPTSNYMLTNPAHYGVNQVQQVYGGQQWPAVSGQQL